MSRQHRIIWNWIGEPDEGHEKSGYGEPMPYAEAESGAKAANEMNPKIKHTVQVVIDHFKGPILSKEEMLAASEGERFRRQEGARMAGLSQVERTPCDCPEVKDHVRSDL